MPLSIPSSPPLILTPLIRHPAAPRITAQVLALLRKSCEKLIKTDTTFSVTFSPLLCPAGKNFLWTLKPYWWEVRPGEWEHRDGQRNPYCDQPQGQSQLQKLSLAISDLTFGSAYLPDISQKCRLRAEELLRVFFVDPETRRVAQRGAAWHAHLTLCFPLLPSAFLCFPLLPSASSCFLLLPPASSCYLPFIVSSGAVMDPRVMYAQTNPGQVERGGDRAFIIACRYLLLVTQSLPHLSIPPALNTALREWFMEHVDWMESSPQGAEARGYGNNITIWYYAVLATHRAQLYPTKSVAFARTTLSDLQHAHPTPPQFFARELSRTRPRHYVLFTLEPLFLLATQTALPDFSASYPGSSQPELDQVWGERTRLPHWVVAYLCELVSFAKTVEPGKIEVTLEGFGRYEARLAWFERMLDRWAGRKVGPSQPKGEGWPKGWDDHARVMWEMI